MAKGSMCETQRMGVRIDAYILPKASAYRSDNETTMENGEDFVEMSM
jgi:hypothetical protein